LRQKGIITGVLLGKASSHKRATTIAETYTQCPYCVSYVSSGCTIIGVFSLPQDHKWWLEWVAEKPEETLGLQRAEVFFTERIKAISPWSAGNVIPILEIAPCGANCMKCFHYQKDCEGCPSTQYYDYVR